MSALASKLKAPPKQLIMIGVLAAVLLGAVLYFFVRSGGNEVAPATAPAPAPATTPEPEVEADVDKDADEKDKKKPLQTNTLLGARDVFEALIDESEGAGEGTDVTGEVVDDGSSTTTEPPTTDTDPGTTPVVPPVTPPDDPPDDPDDPPVAKTGWTVRLLTIYSDDGVDKAIVETKNRKTGKTTTHKLVEGQRFARNFKLVSINNDDTASFLYGDESFSLAENQKVTKK